MAFKFSAVCDLLQNLADIHHHDPPLLTADRRARQIRELDGWFKAHRRAIDSLNVDGAAALLSTLLPERRTDRVYGLQSKSLSRSLCRQLGLSSSKTKDLLAFNQRGHGDLADCLERVLDGGGPPALPAVTLGEVDDALLDLASRCQFSSPDIKQRPTLPSDPFLSITNIIRRSYPVEAKWLVRLILKDLSAANLDEPLVLKSIHFLLPDILRYQQDFDAAVQTLKGCFAKYPSWPDKQSAALLRRLVSASYRPKIGVKVSRSTFCKARSIDQCIKVVDKQHWMIERKYDGEFCELHIDLSKGNYWLKIFSKSGKDSTHDRHGLKDILRKSLAIGSRSCRFASQCILLGEMVVYNDLEKQIMPFHKIRRHVSRSGTYLGTSEDSPRDPSEHLMIVYFDLLLLDDNNVMQKPIEERKALLQRLCRTKAGKAIIAESKVLDFAIPDSKRKLMSHLAASVAARHEGLILKPCGRPYLAANGTNTSNMIKLKKDYINGLGDEADMAVVGASYNPQVALAKGLNSRGYTHYHIACLTNPEVVDRYHARPLYKVVGTISCEACIPPDVLAKANTLARLREEDYNAGKLPSAFDIQLGAPKMDVVFREPFVFEILGSSFEKPANCSYWMLRHPRVKKLHQDRTWRDCVSFADLQKLAHQALSAPPDSESQENLRWMDRIERSCRRKIARASAQTTPTSRATTSPLSAREHRLGSGPVASLEASTSPLPKVVQKATLALSSPVKEDDDLIRSVSCSSYGDLPCSVVPCSVESSFSSKEDASQAQKATAGVGMTSRDERLLQALPTPPTSSAVQCEVVDASPTPLKRKAGPVVVPKVKRARLAPLPGYKTRHTPLADITNTQKQNLLPPSSPPSKPSSKSQLRDRAAATTMQQHSAPDGHHLGLEAEAVIACGSWIPPTLGECAYLRYSLRPKRTACPLSRCVVYIEDPSSPAVMHALSHGATVVHHLGQWEGYQSSSPDGLKKVWHLPDGHYNMEARVSAAMQQISSLEHRNFHDRVDFMDMSRFHHCCAIVRNEHGFNRLWSEDWGSLLLASYRIDQKDQSGNLWFRPS